MSLVSFTRAAALLLPLCAVSVAQECSLNTLAGTWIMQGHGTVMMNVPGSSSPVPVPVASLSLMKIDFQGRYTLQGTFSGGGQIQTFSFPGSLQVNSDCTGTDTSDQGSDRFVILDQGQAMRWMSTKFVMGPAIVTADAWRLSRSEPQCSTQMVRGLYVGIAEGTYMTPVSGQTQPAPLPFSGILGMAFPRRGSGTAVSTASLGGAVADFEFPEVAIDVNPDCTATLNYKAGSKQFPGQTFVGTDKYILLNNGDELIGLETEFSAGLPIVRFDLKRISLMPVVPEW
jgi:hypothetical protein